MRTTRVFLAIACGSIALSSQQDELCGPVMARLQPADVLKLVECDEEPLLELVSQESGKQMFIPLQRFHAIRPPCNETVLIRPLL